jgi:PAS domain S-box-containing protein
MNKEIRILYVEDVPADVVMVNHELRKGGLAFRTKRVETKDAFLHELERDPPDLILSDHGLPSFDGFTALAIARDKLPDIPFIFVTSSLGEQVAIETFESGATDYVLKSGLAKLVPAVQRALREAEERMRLRQKEQALRESEERFRMLVEGVKDYAVFMLDKEGRVISWNSGAEWIHGYRAEEVLGQHYALFHTPAAVERGLPAVALRVANAEGRFEEEGLRLGKGGKEFWANVVITVLRDAKGRLRGYAQVTRNITERVLAQEALLKSEERYRSLVELCPDALLVVYAEGRIAFCNTACVRLLGAGRSEDLLNKRIETIFPPENGKWVIERIRRARESGPVTPFVESELVRLDGSRVTTEISAAPFVFQEKPAMQVIAHDISERKHVEDALRYSEARKSAILDTALDAVISINHRGAIQEWNPAAQRIFGYDRAEAVGEDLAELIIPPSLQRAHRDGLEHYLATGEARVLGQRMEMTARRADGSEFPVELSIARVPESDPPTFTGFLRDITQRKLAEETLRKSDSLKTAILETALDGILSIDDEGKIREWNLAAQKIFGYSRAEVLGRPMDELIIPPSLREAYQGGVANYLMTGVGSLLNRPIELTLRRADGTEFRAELAITRVRAEEPSGCTALIRDVTERNKSRAALRESEERFRLLVEGVTDYGIYMLDPEGRVATWNAGAERLEGYRVEEILGKHLSTFFPAEDVQSGLPERALRRAASEGKVTNEGWRIRKDGSRFWSVGIITALRDESGQLRGFVKVAHDMTARKEAEEEVQRLNAELEGRVVERTAQLEAANHELEAFSYSVSHDLRAPLRHIAGYAEILRSDSATTLDDQGKAHLNTISEAARQMGVLIDALLAFSRMGRSEMRRQPVGLAALLGDARRQLHREIEGRNIDWQVGDLPEVHGDPVMLGQVVINLLSNALKYTRTRPVARIEIGASRNERETVFFIRDNGAGFDMRYVDKLFGVFQRLHSPSEFEGTGIGLANVRRIVRRHGGRVWAEGAVERGATFYFSIPHSHSIHEPTENHDNQEMDSTGRGQRQ